MMRQGRVSRVPPLAGAVTPMPSQLDISDPRFEHALLEALDAEAPVGLAVLDLELRHVRVNDALCRMMQLTPEDILGKSPRAARARGRRGRGDVPPAADER